MSFKIRRVEYFYSTVEDSPGEGYKLLSALADLGVNLLAFTSVPVGPTRTQLTLFPEDGLKMADAARKAGLAMDGPHSALLVQGEDELGALARVHATLYDARVNVYASTAVTDGEGHFGYLLYVGADEIERAAEALGI